MQKSQLGLLQTLLYQVLRQFPALIPSLCDGRWNGEEDGFDPWSFDELFNAFERLAKQTLISTKLCFFIDGLDEYDGNHTELTRLVKNLASVPSIKLCVSSRPWYAFDKAFGGSEQKLKLEDLTKSDIRNYVRSKLQENDSFRELENQDPHCNEIVADMVKRAQGVFLWVYLVVDSLIKGLDEGDDARDLRKRLDSLPDDLEEYFRHMLRTIDSTHREQTYKIFQITVQAMQPLPVLAFEFLETEEENPSYALEIYPAPYSDDQAEEVYTRMKGRLNARCKDLLEINTDLSETGISKRKVDFLHRTVRDFFVNTNVLEEMLNRNLHGVFDVHLSLCKIMLALTKLLERPIEADSSSLNQIFLLADELMYHAWQFEKSRITPADSSQISMEVELLDELDHVLVNHTEPLRMTKGNKSDHWTNYRDLPRGLFDEYHHKTFLASAIQFKLVHYVRRKLETRGKALQRKDGRPLLDSALRPNMVTPLQLQHLDATPNIPMVRLLLEKGANPNQSIYIYGRETVWGLFLQQCYNTPIRGSSQQSNMGELLQVLIEGGANPNISFKNNFLDLGPAVRSNTDREIVTISDVLNRTLRESEIARLDALLSEKRQSRFSIWKLQGIWSTVVRA